MARAKRTRERTDARRRYRQAQLNAAGEGEESAAPAAAAATPGRPAGRPSFTAAFRSSYHRANLREDLPYLPSLLRHWSFWVALLLMVGTVVLALAVPRQALVLFMFQTFVYPPALIVMFITGFFAKRASYLLGAILGVMNVVVYGVFEAFAGAPLYGADQVPNATLQAFFLNTLLISPASGILFCSLAAWYRRFLYLTNPNRGRRQQPKGKPKPSGRPLLGR